MEQLTLTAYRHSGKFGLQGPALALAASAIAAFPLGLAYAYVIKWIPFIYLNVLLTIGYGMAFGFLTGRVLKFMHVRNTKIATLCGIGGGLFALYFNWNGHVYALFDHAPLICRPDEIWRVMQALYEHGSWSLRHGGNVTGVVLAIVWVVEAGTIVFFAAIMPSQFIGGLPYCEESHRWLDESKVYNTLEPLDAPEKIAALKAGDIAPLLEAKAKPAGSNVFTRLTLKHSSQCKTFCTLRVQHVSLTPEKDGKMKETVTDLTGDLVLPADMLEMVERFANVS